MKAYALKTVIGNILLYKTFHLKSEAIEFARDLTSTTPYEWNKIYRIVKVEITEVKGDI